MVLSVSLTRGLESFFHELSQIFSSRVHDYWNEDSIDDVKTECGIGEVRDCDVALSDDNANHDNVIQHENDKKTLEFDLHARISVIFGLATDNPGDKHGKSHQEHQATLQAWVGNEGQEVSESFESDNDDVSIDDAGVALELVFDFLANLLLVFSFDIEDD